MFAASLVLAGAAWAQSEQAQQILKDTGVTGGLVVHVGCGDGKLTAALRANEAFLVHGLDADVTAARANLQAAGLYGPVSVERWNGGALPYADNLVRLLVISDAEKVSRAEIERVLCPGGLAYSLHTSSLIPHPFRKPWPADIDSWSHYLHDASNNAVSGDRRVGPPRRLQWLADPLWSRTHELAPSVVGVVSSGGRLFYVEDEGPRGLQDTRFPEKWSLAARDAFNGKLLWRRAVPPFNPGFVYWLSFQNDHNRRIVAAPDRVYYAPGNRQPVIAINAATGQDAVKFADTDAATALMLQNGVLVCAGGGALTAHDAVSGKLLWKQAAASSDFSIACDDERVVYMDKQDLVAADLKSGAVRWRQPLANNKKDGQSGKGGGQPARIGMVVLAQKKVFIALAASQAGYEIAALAIEDGRPLWRKEIASKALFFSTPPELFFVNGTVWASTSGIGLDPDTGETRLNVRVDITGGHHQRCHMRKATVNYLLGGKRGIEFIALEPDVPTIGNDWVRGTCKVGITPANGLLYVPPNACFCHPGVMLGGFKALAAEGAVSRFEPLPDSERLVKGPAYEQTPKSDVNNQRSKGDEDWPGYRADAARSGSSATELPGNLAKRWTVDLRAPLTPPVIADGRVFLAEKDAHTIVALDEANGTRLWTFTAGGRIDSPPTIHEGRVHFGCRDGRVYALRASDGMLAWAFHAAPARRLVVCREQVESAWPVSGSVIVVNGRVYCAAGRSTYLDSGIALYALDAHTGAVIASHTLRTEQNAETKDLFRAHDIALGGNADLLVWSGQRLHMGRLSFDANLNPVKDKPLDSSGAMASPPFLAVSSGFLDDAQHNRSQWTYLPAWPGMHYATYAPRCGQLLVFDKTTTYAGILHDFLSLSGANVGGQAPRTDFLPAKTDLTRSPGRQAGNGVWLVADRNTAEFKLPGGTRESGGGIARTEPPLWQTNVPVRVRAMALAKNGIAIAGPPDALEPSDPLASFNGLGPAILSIHSRENGEKKMEIPLASQPVFDGLAVAKGKVFLSVQNGQVVCLFAE